MKEALVKKTVMCKSEINMEDINGDTVQDLIIWLYSHEEDIAAGINDFGDLQQVFFEFCGREAGAEGSTPVMW